MPILPGESLRDRIQQWNQGDCVLEALPFFWGFDQGQPLTDLSHQQAEGSASLLGVALGAAEVAGLVVVSQTCDLVRKLEDRPYAQVAPLVQVGEAELELVRLRMRPRFVYLPTLATRGLVGDLDRILTVEKAFLATWKRHPGFKDELQRRSFAESLRRYYNRPAFPKAFVDALKKLDAWFHDKHDRTPDPPKKGPAPFHPGACLRALAMVLVRPRPSWDAPAFHVDFILVQQPGAGGIPAEDWETFRHACIGKVLLPPEITAHWSDMPLGHLPAKLYLESDLLDLDYLSDETRRMA